MREPLRRPTDFLNYTFMGAYDLSEQGASKCPLAVTMEVGYFCNMPSARLFRVIVPVSNIDEAASYYAAVLANPGRRISPGRHYFDCGQCILACFDPRADGDP